MKLLFIDGTGGFSPHRLKEKACGGIITSLTLIPQFLYRKYEVYVLSGYEKEEVVSGVHYINKLDNLDPDVVVFNRNVINRSLIERFKKAIKIWWLHDIVDHRYLEDDAYRYVDKIVALSRYCVNAYSDFYDIDKNKFTIIENGVDREVFYTPTSGYREKKIYICASASIKGLKPILFTFQNLKRIIPDIDFRIYSSQKLHDMKDDSQTQAFYQTMKDLGANVLEPIPQKDLAEVMRSAWCLLMPNSYPEICSNLLLQAQACGLPIVATPVGSIGEYIEHEKTGLLTKTYPHDLFWWWKDFTYQAARLYFDDELHSYISRTATVNVFSWDYIGNMWYEMIEKLVNKESI